MKEATSIYADTFYTVSPEDSDLWMDLFMYADVLDPYFAGMLQYLRNSGTTLEKDERFGYRLVPVIGSCRCGQLRYGTCPIARLLKAYVHTHSYRRYTQYRRTNENDENEYA